MNDEKLKYFELAIAYFAALPEGSKIKLTKKASHEPVKFIDKMLELSIQLKEKLK